jgi:Protein of unknown function (DUF2817)
LLDETTFVITHSLNPWGFKNANRFNRNNVDLNRNCGGEGELQQLDLDPRFKTCNDEAVWLRRVEPDRQPKVGTGLNGYLTAEIGGQGGLDSVCAVLMAQQLALRQRTGKPLFKGDSAAEREFRNQVFRVFNPADDKIDTQSGSKTYPQILDDHATYSCQAIEKYIRGVLAPPN